MKRAAATFLAMSAVALTLTIQGQAQDKPAPAASNDPRVGLKPGFRDAGHAARNMELVSTMPSVAGSVK